MNNNFLNPENEKNELNITPLEKDVNTYEPFPEDIDVFADDYVSEDAVSEAEYTDDTADVFDRPVCTEEVPDDFVEEDTTSVIEAPVPNCEADEYDFEIILEDEEDDTTDSISPTAPVYYNPSVKYEEAASSLEPMPSANPFAEQPQPTAAAYTAPFAPAVKKNKGATAFIITLWVLVGVFAIGFFGLCGYIIGTSNSNTSSTRPTLFSGDNITEYTEPETTPVTEETDNSDSSVIPFPDNSNLYSKGTTIELNAFPADSSNTAKYNTQYAYKKVADSTIGVVCYNKSYSDDPASEGTGIILTSDGYIATNSHVIGDSRTLYKVKVITNDGTTYEAKVIGYDSRTDLAVLKINAKGLTYAEFCDSKYVEAGQDVIAVGNPGGMDFQNSLTRGVVSALNRELALSSQVSYIQTDAAINPGNSGGPLCNMYGQVIGINTAKISSDSYEGMGFAIPSSTVKEIIDDLIATGYVSNRVRIGISGQTVTSEMEQYYNIPAGILVGKISEDGPCHNSGLKINDVITKIDSEDIESFSDVYAILSKHKPGDKVVLTVYRMGTKATTEITITLMADNGETQQ